MTEEGESQSEAPEQGDEIALLPDRETLVLCRAEIANLRVQQDALIANYNSRAGFLIGASGVIIALQISSSTNWMAVVGQGVAAAASAAAAFSLIFQGADSLIASGYQEYAQENTAQEVILGHVIASEVVNQTSNAEKVKKKRVCLAAASVLLVTSLGFVVAGTADGYIENGKTVGHTKPTQVATPSPGPQDHGECRGQQARAPRRPEEGECDH